ncbi:putative C2 domain-containing protein 5 [Apostichopus japonicus]|uniref:Putative C2 domain-containing protein 5 n=1 Tax=Stichopus japonicus TaxID=307972 RepID=A0A2G8JJR9_STIJA|nr:putative C2 domain-containing protein 5 [Apostichopus japonicus]
MPGKLKVRILAARDLPVMDRASDLADAFVEVRFGQATEKTEVFRKSLNPQWNADWFKFEVDDEELQDEPLQIRVLDYDTYSAHDTIGKVYIDLNSLLWKDGVSEISGWMPIFDTMHGIRGEIKVMVRVELIEDANQFRQSSCGVHFFSSSRVPSCYTVQAIHGFVEELVVNNDPEYQWIDMIRTPRASNEARQRLFSKLSGELQRKIGLKVLEVEGNAVIGYWQCFDMEGESGVVVRGIGTAATLKKTAAFSPPKDVAKEWRSKVIWGQLRANCENLSNLQNLNIKGAHICMCRCQYPGISCEFSTATIATKQLPQSQQQSDPDLDASGVLGSSGGSGGLTQRAKTPKLMLGQKIAMMEYPFFTITTFPPNFLEKLGGAVTARSVKLLDRIHNPGSTLSGFYLHCIGNV